jgi:hypothetical protein
VWRGWRGSHSDCQRNRKGGSGRKCQRPQVERRVGGIGHRERQQRKRRLNQSVLQRGLLVGVSVSNVEGTVYLFNPGSDDHILVMSIGVTF